MKALASVLLTVGLSIAWTASPRPASADIAAPSAPCIPPPGLDFCVELPHDPPTPPSDPGEPGRPGARDPSPRRVCVWTAQGPGASPGGDALGSLPLDPGTRPSPESVLVWEVCDGVGTGRVRWSTPGEAVLPAPPNPADLAAALRVRLEGSLPAPEVGSDPAPGVASFVNSPVFVAVANWTGEVEAGPECDPSGLLCVWVRAVPAMTWSPGEPGAPMLACAGAGSRYDPAGPSPEAQALGACAYTFTRRTGVEGRPAAWPGVVSVTWTLSWRASTGQSGPLPSVVKAADVGRPVGEVQAIVTEVD